MAVQKSKVTRSRRGQRRSHDSPDGFYRGRQVIATPVEVEDDEDE